MISNTAQTNTFTAGLDLDNNLSLMLSNSYRDAHNIRVITNDGGTTATILLLEKSKKYKLSLAIEGTIAKSLTIKNIGVIISYFYKTTPGDAYYNIYRLENFDSSTIKVTKVLSGILGLDPYLPLSVVGNCESDDIYKIYFTDGTTSIQVLNLFDERFLPGSEYVDDDGYILDNKLISITPTATLTRPTYIGVTNGNLKAGKVAYCYLLFNENGTLTLVSPMTLLIHLAISNTEDADYYKGSMPDDTINRGVIIQISDIPEGFERIRIIRIMFTENNSVPKIEVAVEQKTQGASVINYTDTGNVVTEYTVDQFNAISTYLFTAKVLAKKDNRLFAANITENSWNPTDEEDKHYDARAYRCNANGAVLLESLISENNISIDDIDSYDLTSIPEDHDCINPFNTKGYDNLATDDDVDNMYMYGRKNGDTRVLGGYGTNIDYSFIVTRVDLSELADSNFSKDSFIYNIKSTTNTDSDSIYKVIGIYELGTSNEWSIRDSGDSGVCLHTYASPFFASHFTGYRRDELYRFGIVFYNSVGVATPVYWIGDIRMPSMLQVPVVVRTNGKVYGQALGIRFNVKNIPAGAVSYEIVRCEKTEEDRNIIGQVAVSGIYNYRITDDSFVGNGSVLDQSTEYRPLPFFNANRFNSLQIKGLSGRFMTDDGNMYEMSAEELNIPSIVSDTCLRITSPEICLLGESMVDMIRGAKLNYLGHYYSLILPSVDDRRKNFASYSSSSTLYKDDTYTTYNDQSGLLLTYFSFREPGNEIIPTNLDVCRASYLSKYFYYVPNLIESYSSITDAVYPPCIEYNKFNGDGSLILSAYTVSIGNVSYTNYAMSSFSYARVFADELYSQPILGPAGPCIIISRDNKEDLFLSGLPYDDTLSLADAANCVALGNIVVDKYSSCYGGNSYAARTESIYIPTGNYNVDGAEIVYGGDTYVGIFDYLNTSTYQPNDNSLYAHSRHSVYSYIPMESDVNLNLLSGEMVHNTNPIPLYMQLLPVQMGDYYTQTKPYYEYNDAYSAQNTTKLLATTSMYSEDYKKCSNRILVSEAKVNGEVTDSWSLFRVANYLDVDNLYGDITNMCTFKNNLFFWLDNAVGIASVNERSLISDDSGSGLVLGTGGILTRYDYLTNTNGSSLVNNNTIVYSDNILYWYDDNKNELCSYNGSVNILSKEKRIQSYFNSNKNTLYGYTTMNALFDKKYNEVWFKIFNDNIVFNELLSFFTSKYNHLANTKSLTLFDKCVIIDNNDLYEINRDDLSAVDETNRDADITLVINKDYEYTKVFDNIRFYTEPNANAISKIEFKTQNNKQQAVVTSPKFDYREDTYRLPVPRLDNFNEEENMSFPARLRSKCMTEKFNFTVDENNKFNIPYITTTYRYSLI